MRRHGIGRFFSVLLAAMLLAAVCLAAAPVKIIVERAKYVWSDGGVETWEDAAVKEGIDSEAEEYYYENLPEEFHETYREIYVRVMKNEDSGSLYSSIGVDDFWKIYYAVLADHPEIFWIDTSAQVQESGLTGKVIGYSFDTTVPGDARPSMKERIESAADECISQIPPDATEYEKIKFVYEYIINRTDYDSSGEDNQNIQSVLLNRRSVCAGYSKAFQYILNRMGLFCTYITGRIRDGGDHGWNMVRIGGRYYYVDVTWGDPVFANQVDGAGSHAMNYNYLCCTENDLFRTHEPDGSIPLPSCASDDYNYYIMNNMYYETFDYDTVYSRVMESVWAGEENIVMKFGSRDAYEQAKYELFEGKLLNDAGQYLMDINGTSQWNYRYNTDEGFHLITIYWR